MSRSQRAYELAPVLDAEVVAFLDEENPDWREEQREAAESGAQRYPATPRRYHEAAFGLYREERLRRGNIPHGWGKRIGAILGLPSNMLRQWASRERWDELVLAGAEELPLTQGESKVIRLGERALSEVLGSAIGRAGAAEVIPDVVEHASDVLRVKAGEVASAVAETQLKGLSAATRVIEATAGKRLEEAAEAAEAGGDVNEMEVQADMGKHVALAEMQKKVAPDTEGGAGGGVNVAAKNVFLNVKGAGF